MLAVLGPIEPEPPPWAAALKEIIPRYSTARRYVPFEMIPAWEGAGLFRQVGRAITGPMSFAQPLEEYLAAFHAQSTLTRAHIDARGFDAEVRAAVEPHAPDGIVRLVVRSQVLWGKPLG
jgi:hypothetical protein